MAVGNQIKGVFKSEHAVGGVYLVALGLLASDIIPTPADAVYFELQRRNRNNWEEGKITSQQYWTRDAIYYYGLNPLWWLLVFGGVIYFGKNAKQKLYVLSGLLGAGLVVWGLHKNIQKDEIKQQQLAELKKPIPKS